MNKKNKTQERLFTVFFMFAVTFITISAVSAAHLFTEKRVKRFERLYLKQAILIAAGLDIPEKAENIEKIFDEKISEIKGHPGCFFVRKDLSQEISGYVLMVEGAGLWGRISSAVGFDAKGERIIGMEFIYQNETPGLGARITEPWFKEQFKGKKGPFHIVAEGESDGENEFEAITGATITTTAVKEMTDGACEKVQKLRSQINR